MDGFNYTDSEMKWLLFLIYMRKIKAESRKNPLERDFEEDIKPS